jgi:undecaprenyl-diphosphatase
MTLLTGGVGLGIYTYLHTYFTSKYLLAFCFLANAGILLSIKNTGLARDTTHLRWQDSLLLGILQGVSLLPGISRSGITITALLKRGFKKEETFVISFLMAVPTMLGVFVLRLISRYQALAAESLSLSPIISRGFLSAFVSAFLCGILALKIVKRVLVTEKFKNFAYYCILISLVSLLV